MESKEKSIDVLDTGETNQDLKNDNSSIETKKQVVNRINQRMEKYQTYCSWVLDVDEFKKYANEIYQGLSKYLKMINDEDNLELKYNTWEVVSRKLTQVYLAIRLKKFPRVRKLFTEVKLLIQRCCEGDDILISSDYRPGLQYCLKGIEVVFICRHSLMTLKLGELQKLDKSILRFSRLGKAAKVAVIAMKFSFIRLIKKNSYEVQELLLERMKQKNPENGNWYFWQYNVRKILRRQKLYFERPDDEEIALIVKAVEFIPNNPRILISLYTVLAEIVRFRGPYWKGIEDLGFGQIFRSSVQIVQFLKVETRKVLVFDSTSAEINMSVAEMFSSILPFVFWDVLYAKMCLERALIFHQKCSLANGRMGFFLLTSWKDPVTALLYLERSFHFDKRNFEALFDVLMTCFSNDCERNRFKIEHTLNLHLENSRWSEKNHGYLYFVRGLKFYMDGDFKKCFDNWITTFEKCGDMNVFKNFTNYKDKYGWQNDKLNPDKISICFIINLARPWFVELPQNRTTFELILKVLREGHLSVFNLTTVSNMAKECEHIWWKNYCGPTYSQKGPGQIY